MDGEPDIAAGVLPASAPSASAGGTTPFSASFSIVSFSIRFLRIRYQRIKASTSTGERKTIATTAMTIPANSGSLWMKSLNESYSRSSPKTPTVTPFRCFPGPTPNGGGDTTLSGSPSASDSAVADFSTVMVFLPLPSVSTLMVACAPLASFARVELPGAAGGFGAAGAIAGADAAGGFESWAWTVGIRGPSENARATARAVPRTIRRMSREGIAAVAGPDGDMKSPGRRGSLDWMPRAALSDSASF